MSVDTIKAPRQETDEKGHHEHGIVATLCDASHFHLVFDERLDADMQPELDDFSLVVAEKRIDLASLRLTSGVRKGGAWSLISFSLKTKGAIKPGSVIQLTYHPRHYFLWSEDRDEPIEGFELQATAAEGSGLNSMDLRTKDSTTAGDGDNARLKAQARIVEACERQIRVTLKHELETRLNPHVEDFRAECNARRLTIDRVYLSRVSGGTELSLFLRELLEPEGRVKVSYKSGKASLRTTEGELLDGFRVEAQVLADEEENEQTLAALADVDHLLELARLGADDEPVEETATAGSNNVVRLFSETKEEEAEVQNVEPQAPVQEAPIQEVPVQEAPVQKVLPQQQAEQQEPQPEQPVLEEAALPQTAVTPEQIAQIESEPASQIPSPVPETAPAPKMPILRKPVTRIETTERVLPQQVVIASVQEQTGMETAADAGDEGIVDTEVEVTTRSRRTAVLQRLRNLSPADLLSLTLGAGAIGWGLFALINFGALIFSFGPDEQAQPNLIQQLTTPVEPTPPQDVTPQDVTPQDVSTAQIPDQRESCELTYDDGSRFNGSCLDGLRDGGGSLNYANGDIYNGEWKDDQPHGNGMLQKSTGEIYAGGFQNGMMHGRGSYRWPDGRIYEGEFQNDKYHGQGTLTEADGRRFEGRFEDGREVEGICHRPDGIKISGSCDVPD